MSYQSLLSTGVIWFPGSVCFFAVVRRSLYVLRLSSGHRHRQTTYSCMALPVARIEDRDYQSNSLSWTSLLQTFSDSCLSLSTLLHHT
jgi:hypothetical protein